MEGEAEDEVVNGDYGDEDAEKATMVGKHVHYHYHYPVEKNIEPDKDRGDEDAEEPPKGYGCEHGQRPSW